MMRSMYSGVSGLRAHQLKMDTIGNNIANVNTVGFKSQRVTFQEVFNQTIKGAGSAQDGKGGTNPQQVGLGISISSVDTFFIRGAVQRTDNITDLAINGDGFFMLSNDEKGINRSYSRAGNFSLDEDGDLVAANGFRVMGYMADPATGELKSNLEGIRISKTDAVPAKASSLMEMVGNLDNTITKVSADPTRTPYAAAVGTTPAVPETINFPSGTKSWETTSTIFDSLGGQHNIKLTFVRGTIDGAKTATAKDSDWNVYAKDMETQSYFKIGKATATTPGPGDESAPGGTTAATSIDDLAYNLKFTTAGVIDTTVTSGKIKLVVAGKNGSASTNIALDLSTLTQFANESNAAVTKKDGYPQGSLDTFSIGSTGEISGIFTNGESKIIGRIALAAFKNPAGLEKTSENMYQGSPNSGEPIIGMPGTGGVGSLNPGTLEMSNVDLSREFSDMITTQRGFQANSRIITTSDEMLQEMVNLKR